MCYVFVTSDHPCQFCLNNYHIYSFPLLSPFVRSLTTMLHCAQTCPEEGTETVFFSSCLRSMSITRQVLTYSKSALHLANINCRRRFCTSQVSPPESSAAPLCDGVCIWALLSLCVCMSYRQSSCDCESIFFFFWESGKQFVRKLEKWYAVELSQILLLLVIIIICGWWWTSSKFDTIIKLFN